MLVFKITYQTDENKENFKLLEINCLICFCYNFILG